MGFRPNKDAVELLHSAGYIDLRNNKINKLRVNINALLNKLLVDYMRSPAGPLLHKSSHPLYAKLTARLKEFNTDYIRTEKRMRERDNRNKFDGEYLTDLREKIKEISYRMGELNKKG